jgi:disulfide bond formation protein DsbB
VNTAALQLFFALLAVFVNAATVLLVTTLVFRRTGWGRVVLTTFTPFALPLAFLVSLTATAGSLWFSEAVGFIPCKLCWYQRIAVFPLPLLLGAMMLHRDLRVARYVLPVTLVGAMVSLYHWLVERVPALSGSTSCAVDVPCSVPWFTEFGFVTLAWMALSTLTFVAVAILAGNAGAASTGSGKPAS